MKNTVGSISTVSIPRKNDIIAKTNQMSFACKTSRLVRISLLINALNKGVLVFFLGKVIL